MKWRTIGNGVTLAASIGAELVWVWPLPHCSGSTCAFAAGGYIWRLASLLPAVHGSSILFFLLATAGSGVLVAAWYQQRFRSPALWIAATFSLVVVDTAGTFQNHFDSAALLICLLFALNKREKQTLALRWVLALLCLGFGGYAFLV